MICGRRGGGEGLGCPGWPVVYERCAPTPLLPSPAPFGTVVASQRVAANWSGTSHPSEVVRKVSIVVVGLLFVLPLSLVRTMTHLARSSVVSLGAVVWIILVVFIRAVGPAGGAVVPEAGSEDNRVTVGGDHFFAAIGVVGFAFVCHHNSFLIFQTLKVPCVLVGWGMGTELQRPAALTRWCLFSRGYRPATPLPNSS